MFLIRARVFTPQQAAMILGITKDELVQLYCKNKSKLQHNIDYIYDDELDEYCELYYPFRSDFRDGNIIGLMDNIMLSEVGLRHLMSELTTIESSYMNLLYKVEDRISKDMQLLGESSTAMFWTLLRDFATNEIKKEKIYSDKLYGDEEK